MIATTIHAIMFSRKFKIRKILNMKISIPGAKYKLSWIFILMYFLPSFIFVFFKQSSLAVGIAIVSILIILFDILQITNRKIGVKGLILFVLVIMLLLIESFHSVYSFNDSKPIMSIPVVILMIIAAWSLSFRIENSDEIVVKDSFKFALCVFLFFGWLAVFRTIDIGNYASKGKGAFPFSEDSHYALCAGFLSCIVGSTSSFKGKLFILLNISAQAILFPNLTLLVFSLICCFLFWFSNRFLLLAVLICVVAVSGTLILQSMQGTFAGDYLLSRMDLSKNSNNLTTLVFLQGIDDSIRALTDTYGIGLGFQRAGTDTLGEYGYLIKVLTGGEYNRTDGGFLSSKIITEFGVMGLMASLLYTLLILRSVTNYRQSDSQTVRQSDSQTVRQSDSQTVRQSDSQTVRQSDSQTVSIS
ncbi:hypothetical protein ACYBM2_00250 [Klebsiella pneumoniae]